jgi:hypothetical protein
MAKQLIKLSNYNFKYRHKRTSVPLLQEIMQEFFILRRSLQAPERNWAPSGGDKIWFNEL